MNPTTELLLTFKSKGKSTRLQLTLEEAQQLQQQLEAALGPRWSPPVVVPIIVPQLPQRPYYEITWSSDSPLPEGATVTN